MDTLVIGYGNSLRGDDGLGPAAADIVRAWNLPGVRVFTCQQLMPELIEELKRFPRVLFIDAWVDAGQERFTSEKLAPKKSRHSLGHHETPADLLALMCELEGAAPPAWLVTITASSLAHGDALTPSAEKNMSAALAWIRTWLEEDVTRS